MACMQPVAVVAAEFAAVAAAVVAAVACSAEA